MKDGDKLIQEIRLKTLQTAVNNRNRQARLLLWVVRRNNK